MPVVYEGDTAQFLDVCTVDEALDLLEWLRGQPRPKIDLEPCSHLHTTLFQLILATRPEISGPPGAPFLRRCLGRDADRSVHGSNTTSRGESP